MTDSRQGTAAPWSGTTLRPITSPVPWRMRSLVRWDRGTVAGRIGGPTDRRPAVRPRDS